MAGTVQKLESHSERNLSVSWLRIRISLTILNECHLFAVCNNKEPYLSLKLGISLELKHFLACLLAIIEVYQISEP